MARKYNLISELYDRTCKTVVANPQNWQNFLQSACRNYKLRYDEQLLIYAQRPDATAVLEIERWNRNFGRWVNRGARGIAVFADEDRKTQRLSHYFDISDTHEGRYSRPVPLWAMQEEYTEAVIETLENTFGQLTYKSVLSDAVMSAAQNAAEDNLPDYLQDLLYVADNSFLAGLDEGMITTIYKKLVTNSVAYMMMARLGINVGEYFEAEDFRDVTNFNTQETLNALGFATSDIAEMGLSEISKTIRALSRNNRIIEADRQSGYNRDENTTERSGKNERDHIHDGRGLQPSGSDLARTAGAGGGQMVTDEENISQRTAQSPVLQSPDERNPDKTFVGSTAEGKRTGGNTGAGDGSQGGTDRTDESGRHDELGSADEQHQELGSGDRESTGHLRLEYDDKKEAKYAAYRATNNSRIMGDCTGSKKQYSFRLTNENSTEVHLFECAIDLLSFATLARIEGEDWRKLNLVSLSGVYSPKQEMEKSKVPVTLQKLLEKNPQISRIVLHFDNDIAGRKAAKGTVFYDR